MLGTAELPRVTCSWHQAFCFHLFCGEPALSWSRDPAHFPLQPRESSRQLGLGGLRPALRREINHRQHSSQDSLLALRSSKPNWSGECKPGLTKPSLLVWSRDLLRGSDAAWCAKEVAVKDCPGAGEGGICPLACDILLQSQRLPNDCWQRRQPFSDGLLST